jgi:hypothetical protein
LPYPRTLHKQKDEMAGADRGLNPGPLAYFEVDETTQSENHYGGDTIISTGE